MHYVPALWYFALCQLFHRLASTRGPQMIHRNIKPCNVVLKGHGLMIDVGYVGVSQTDPFFVQFVTQRRMSKMAMSIARKLISSL